MRIRTCLCTNHICIIPILCEQHQHRNVKNIFEDHKKNQVYMLLYRRVEMNLKKKYFLIPLEFSVRSEE